MQNKFKKNGLILLKICITFILILSIIYIFSIIKYFFSFFITKYEIKKIENFFAFCNNYQLIKKFQINNNPKISIISPIYNSGKFLFRFFRSIQYQYFNDIEIVLVDDCSIDNSIEIINEYKKEDQRIQLIKNRRKKGTFIARNIGALYAKGKYIIIPDSDDIIIYQVSKMLHIYLIIRS